MATHKKFVWRETKLSLHERFTMLRNRQQQQQQDSSADEVRRSLAAAQRQASAQNQRLLLQMERRPALLAALKLKQKSLRQRLGPNRPAPGYVSTRVLDRLSIPVRSPIARPRGIRPLALGLRGRTFRPQTQFSPARPIRTFGRSRQILRKGPQANVARGRSLLAMDTTPRFQQRPQFTTTQNRPNQFQTRRPLNRPQFANKTQFVPSNSQAPRGFQNQVRNQNQNQNQFRQNRPRNQFQPQRRNQNQQRPGRPGNAGPQNFNKGRGNPRNRNFKGAQGNQNQRNQQGNRQQGGQFRRNQGRGRNGRQGAPPTKEELDLQLDQYMASTKSSLDKELDSYMNQSET